MTDPQRRHGGAGELLAVLLMAACLRPAIVAFGPLAHRIGEDLALGPAELGVLAALPVLAFGLISAFVARPARAIGFNRTAVLALVVVAVGIAARLLPGALALWGGTALVGIGVAVLNVLLPAMVKRDFPDRVPVVTGFYSSTLGGAAGLGVAVAAPIAVATGGNWRLGLAASLPIVLAAILVMAIRVARGHLAGPRGGVPEPSVHSRLWSSPLAWAVTAYMGLQSTVFYTFINWMPSIERSVGISEVDAGLHLSLGQLLGIPAGLLAAAWMGRARDQRRIAVGMAPVAMAPILGALAVPGLMPLWTALLGGATGAMLSIALALIGERAGSPVQAARLSGMAQSVGYLVAAAGPVLAGGLHSATDGWDATLWMMVLVCAGFGAAGIIAGRRGTLQPGVGGESSA